MRYLLVLAASCTSSLVAAHGYLKQYSIDGTTYPAFDPRFDNEPKWGVKRVDWGMAKGTNPVENVRSLDITCRFRPLKEPGIQGVARAGANVTFKWTDWFKNHKGPLLTYMGLMNDESQKPETVDFFKIHEETYDPKTMTWGSDWLVQNNNFHTVTIPSDIKPGTYMIRHELISLHNALNDNFKTEVSGAQFYPQCVKVQVTGDGTATPSGGKFPGTYKWDDKGILINLYYRPNEYISPGGHVYKPTVVAPPKGPQPVVNDTGGPTGELAVEYKRTKDTSDKSFEKVVHADSDQKQGGGGCIWEPGADPKTAKCAPTNPDFPQYRGHAQPPESPMYIDEPSAKRAHIPGPKIIYLFDPTKPRASEQAAKTGKVAVSF